MPETLKIICQRYPYPPRRGDQLAVKKLIDAALKENISVECFFISGPQSRVIENVSFTKLQFNVLRFVKNLRNIFSQPFQMMLFGGFLASEICQDDKIYAHTIRVVPAIPENMWRNVALAPQIDFASEFLERSRATQNAIMKKFLKYEALRIRKWQTINFRKFKKLFRVVDTEFTDYGTLQFTTSPHGFLASRVNRSVRQRPCKNTFTIGFWGNLGFQPNMEACNLLLSELGDDNRFEILIFGLHSDSLKTNARNVNLLGAVDSVDEHIKDCDAMLNLIKTGGGFQNKTIEAWAQGIPVFGYEQAFRGLSGISNIIQNYENADKLYTDLLAIDRASFLKLSTDWILENWNEEKNAKAKLMELGFKL